MQINVSLNIGFFILAIALLASCSNVQPQKKVAPNEPVIEYNKKDFNKFIGEIKNEAVQKGISRATAEEALRDVQFIPKVIVLDRKQPEKTKTFREYISSVLNQKRKDDAKNFYGENQALLESVGNQYGVDPQVIVALWGMESNFGRNMGNFNIIPALATLAYEGRRAAFWRSELINALKVIDQGHITSASMRGSWAGAMGQSQFMPSTFVSYAVDQDGDGKKDIWNDKDDVFGSIANYLNGLGWEKTHPICERVSLPAGFNLKEADIKNSQASSYWISRGIKSKFKADNVSLINLEENKSDVIEGGNYYLVYDNYKRIMKWNRSLYFATSICMLENSI